MPTGKVYIDKALTQISQAWRNEDDSFIAEKLFPVIEVDRETGIYFEYGKENLKKPTNTLRTGRGATPESSYSRTQKNYGPLAEHDLKDYITWKEMKTYDNPLDPETDTINFLNEQMSIEREIALALKLSDTAVVTNNVDLSATPLLQFNDYDNSTPFITLQSGVAIARKAMLRNPNTIFMGQDVWDKLVNHPDLLDRVKWSSLGVLTEELFLRLMANQGITNIYVGKTIYDSAAEGLTSNMGYAWGKHLWLAYINPSKKPNLRTVNGGFTLVLKDGRYVDRWDDKDEKVNFYRNNDFYEQKLVGADCFYLFKNAVA